MLWLADAVSALPGRRGLHLFGFGHSRLVVLIVILVVVLVIVLIRRSRDR